MLFLGYVTYYIYKWNPISICNNPPQNRIKMSYLPRVFHVGILSWSPTARKYCFVIPKFPRYDYENSRSKPDIEKVELYQQAFNLVYEVHKSLGDILAMHIYMKNNSIFKPSVFLTAVADAFPHQHWPFATWVDQWGTLRLYI